MRRVDYLIEQVRRETENEDVTATTGISDEEFIQYLNDGQDRIQALIQVQFPDVFQDDSTVDAIRAQEKYDIPKDAFLGVRIDNIEYSNTGQVDDFYNLKKASKKERKSGITSSPVVYIRQHNKIILQPAAQNSGKIRFTYQKRLPRLDIRRGTVLTASLNGVNNTITTLTLDPATNLDATALEEDNFITIVDRNGIEKMRRIEIDNVDSSTGVVTVTNGFTYEDLESIEPGDFALRGFESTTHSQLADNAERYLRAYCAWKIHRRDSSSDSQEQSGELTALETDIVKSYAEPDGGVDRITILDDSFLVPDDDIIG